MSFLNFLPFLTRFPSHLFPTLLHTPGICCGFYRTYQIPLSFRLSSSFSLSFSVSHSSLPPNHEPSHHAFVPADVLVKRNQHGLDFLNVSFKNGNSNCSLIHNMHSAANNIFGCCFFTFKDSEDFSEN